MYQKNFAIDMYILLCKIPLDNQQCFTTINSLRNVQTRLPRAYKTVACYNLLFTVFGSRLTTTHTLSQFLRNSSLINARGKSLFLYFISATNSQPSETQARYVRGLEQIPRNTSTPIFSRHISTAAFISSAALSLLLYSSKMNRL